MSAQLSIGLVLTALCAICGVNAPFAQLVEFKIKFKFKFKKIKFKI